LTIFLAKKDTRPVSENVALFIAGPNALDSLVESRLYAKGVITAPTNQKTP
jgi:hypothetical protein